MFILFSSTYRSLSR